MTQESMQVDRATVRNTVENKEKERLTKHKKAKKLILGLVMVVGVMLVIYSFLVFSTSEQYSYIAKESYGGDAYTGIQNAAVTTAWNVRDLGKAFATAMGGLLLCGGLLTILTAVYALVKLSYEPLVLDQNRIEMLVDEQIRQALGVFEASAEQSFDSEKTI